MSSQNPEKSDHERIEAVLKSDEWQRKLEEARIRRAEVLKRRGVQQSPPPLQAPHPGAPDNMVTLGNGLRQPEQTPSPRMIPAAPASGRFWGKLVVGLFLGITIAGLGGWLILARPLPPAPAQEQAASLDAIGPSPGLNHGSPPAARTGQGESLVAANRSDDPVPPRPVEAASGLSFGDAPAPWTGTGEFPVASNRADDSVPAAEPAPGLSFGNAPARPMIPGEFPIAANRAGDTGPSQPAPVLSFGGSPAAWSRSGEFPVASYGGDVPVPPRPPLAELLRRLGTVAPARTRVHVPAGNPISASDSLILVPSRFSADRNLVRYFRPDDRDLAVTVARAIGAETASFDTYTPRPAAGTVEVWIAGQLEAPPTSLSTTTPGAVPDRR